MKPTELWKGKFGDSYIDRNRYEWSERVPFWKSAVEACTPMTVFEFGCNIGNNLQALRSIDPSLELHGCDINAKAVDEAQAAGFKKVKLVNDHGIVGMYNSHSMDLVFTSGVLIHVPTESLQMVMQSLIDLSAKYVLAIEYDADQEQEVEYRGVKGALWKRPYGRLYQDLGLTLIAQGPASGWQDCEFYLLEKPQ